MYIFNHQDEIFARLYDMQQDEHFNFSQEHLLLLILVRQFDLYGDYLTYSFRRKEHEKYEQTENNRN